jgi:sulfite exporter TauE/SafE
MLIGIQHGVVPETLLQAALLIALVLISAIGTGLFLLRFAGALMSINRR